MLSKAFQVFVVVLLIAIPLASCASTKGAVVHQNNINEEKVAADVADRVTHANTLFAAGEYRTAELIYQGLLDEYSTENGALETSLLTNVCMIYLETGERGKFKDCAKRLRKTCTNLPYLSRETQMVLELSDMLEGDTSEEEDIRIESRISNGLNEAFKEGR